MTVPSSTTIAATLIAATAGIVSWFTGLTRAMWPPHPVLGALLITVFVGIVVSQLYPAIVGQKKN